MKSQLSNNDKLDSLAAELLGRSALTHDEVDSIADRGHLYAAVRTTIIAERSGQTHRRKGFSIFEQTAIVSAAAAIIIVAVFGAMSIARRPLPQSLVKSVPPIRQPRVVPDPPASDPVATEIYNDMRPRTGAPTMEKAMAYRPALERRPASRNIREPQFEEQPSSEFYPLADLHPSEEPVMGGRVVRVELPRAAIVALGANLPLDSEKQSFKTDLLIGPDGVPRAIRIVE
jgi:hypothetical protein